jgi:hypothetical protein
MELSASSPLLIAFVSATEKAVAGKRTEQEPQGFRRAAQELELPVLPAHAFDTLGECRDRLLACLWPVEDSAVVGEASTGHREAWRAAALSAPYPHRQDRQAARRRRRCLSDQDDPTACIPPIDLTVD